MRTSKLLLFFVVVLLFLFPSCDKDTDADFPTDIVQHSLVSDATFEILLDDAKMMYVNFYSNEGRKEINDIDINETHLGPLVYALQMVHIDKLLPATQKIRDHNIHSLCKIQLYEGMLTTAPTNQYIQSWLNKGHSGYESLDIYINQYNIILESINEKYYRYRTKKGINHIALAKQLEKIPFIQEAKPTTCLGDGSQIEIKSCNPDYIRLVYSYGWGDCPSGCINRHYWELGVYSSGLVELVDEYGSKLP